MLSVTSLVPTGVIIEDVISWLWASCAYLSEIRGIWTCNSASVETVDIRKDSGILHSERSGNCDCNNNRYFWNNTKLQFSWRFWTSSVLTRLLKASSYSSGDKTNHHSSLANSPCLLSRSHTSCWVLSSQRSLRILSWSPWRWCHSSAFWTYISDALRWAEMSSLINWTETRESSEWDTCWSWACNRAISAWSAATDPNRTSFTTYTETEHISLTALFRIIFASVANRKVDRVSDAAIWAGETVAIIAVSEFPPNESYI